MNNTSNINTIDKKFYLANHFSFFFSILFLIGLSIIKDFSIYELFVLGKHISATIVFPFCLFVLIIKLSLKKSVDRHVPDRWSDLGDEEWKAIPKLLKSIFYMQHIALIFCSSAFGWFFALLILRGLTS
ncbi:MAG: hypothetical protein EON54_04745 [Alcaligenaceae bacterium]|nr:MAG: hypothetical protein EON54_04745 [Alcaligenaceae bacterium]